MTSPRKKTPSRDVALLYAPTDDGKGARILRARDGLLETGEVRPVKDGQALNQGELVRLVPRADAPCLCDVETLHKAAPAEPRADVMTQGPAQVATEDYRANWDRTFGGLRQKPGSALN